MPGGDDTPMRITAIERQPRRRRANLHLDGRLALTLSPQVLAEAGLHIGDPLTPIELERLRASEARHGALATALRLLSYRPRSETELRQRLARSGTPTPLVDETIARLRELGLADDEAFARSWVESRQRSSPRSRRLIALELTGKGVSRQITRQSLAALDDIAESDAAYRAAARRAAALATLPHADFRRRLGNFLLRRGFDYETVRATAARLWEEVTQSEAPDCNVEDS